MPIKSDVLALVEEYKSKTSLTEAVKELRELIHELNSVAINLDIARVAASAKWLPEDVREEMANELNEQSYEVNGNDAYFEDYNLYTDDELLERYKNEFDYGDRGPNELCEEAMGYKAEYEMLTGKKSST